MIAVYKWVKSCLIEEGIDLFSVGTYSLTRVSVPKIQGNRFKVRHQ